MPLANQRQILGHLIAKDDKTRDYWRYAPLYGLWLIAILPKSLQLVFFLFWLTVVAIADIRDASKTQRIDFGLAMLMSMIAVHILSIALNSYGADQDRVMAACNTVSIWFISVAIFFFYSRGATSLRIAAHAALFNVLVAVGLAIAASFADLSFTFLSDERRLNVDNWINGDRGERFVGFLEYSNLVSLMYFVMFPLSLYCVRLWKNPILKYGYCILAMYPVFEASSRSGMLLATVELLIAFAYLAHTRAGSRVQLKSMLLLGILLVLLVVVNWGMIVEAVSSLLASRQGSNVTRSLLYSRSIQDVFDSSPLIGRGIKFVEFPFGDSIPLGSHSTYIGILYKTGILGFTMWFLALMYELAILLRCSVDRNTKVFILAFLSVFIIFLAIEDVDGSNWSLATTFIVAGVAIGHCKRSQGKKEGMVS